MDQSRCSASSCNNLLVLSRVHYFPLNIAALGFIDSVLRILLPEILPCQERGAFHGPKSLFHGARLQAGTTSLFYPECIIFLLT
jgi:hypothetical protein